MVLTASAMLPLGTPLPAFSLPQVADDAGSQALWSSAALTPGPVLVLFLCAHCPFVKHIEPELTRLEHDYGARLQIVAISSNSTVTHPQDGPEGLRAQAERCGWRFPYLFDGEHGQQRSADPTARWPRPAGRARGSAGGPTGESRAAGLDRLQHQMAPGRITEQGA
jgi:thiol-disulfide isomerase/thioredoxin